jgi:hypothetical protein
MPQVVILLRLLPIGRIKRRQIFNRTFTSNGVVTPSRVFTCNPVLFGGGVPTSPKRLFGAGLTTSPKLMTAGLEPRTRQQDLRSTRGRGRRPTPNWGNLRQAAGSRSETSSQRSQANAPESSNCQRSQRLIRSVRNQRRPSPDQRSHRTVVGRSRASTLVAPIAPSAPPSVSPGCEYTTTAPCR